LDDGKGCSSDQINVIEGWKCENLGLNTETICVEICGDGLIIGEEDCDDGNVNDD